MLFRSQPAGSQADPHDAIIAQLRDLAPRIRHEPSQIEETSPSTESLLPASEPSFQATPSNDNAAALGDPLPRIRSHRGILNVLLAICAGVAATTAWHSYGDEAKQRLAQLVPQLLTETPAPPQDANAVEAQDTAAAQAAMPQPQPSAEADPSQEVATIGPQPSPPPTDPIATAPQAAPPVQAALPAEVVQSLETMANDIAALKSAVEDLKTSQQQLRREIAAATEREAHPKPVQQRAKPAPPQRQRTSHRAAVPPSPPLPSPPPPQATERQPPSPQREAYIPSQAPVPARLPPPPGDDSAPRPPLPLR